jgi:splicing factor 3A subunit 1
MGGMGGPPMPPRAAPPPMPEDLRDPKRQRTDGSFVLEAEDEFLATHAGAGKVKVQCPELDGSDKLTGQMLEVEVSGLGDTIGALKERLAGVTGLLANKQRLSRDGVGFVKDNFTLAFYNVGEDVVLTLSTKERGRKK